MPKPKYLYHGSGRKLVGGKLIPKKANDLGNVKDNSLKGIYASSVKEQATSMAMHSCKRVSVGSLQMHKVKEKLKVKDSVVYHGWPKQKYIYLYYLSPKTFKNIPLGSPQWVSLVPTKPLKIEKLLVKDYIHLIKKATKKERATFFKEHKIN